MTQILVVDDQEQNRYYLETLLRGHGFEVVTVENGARALDLARSAPPNLIITDILMPVMDGFELCRVWKADERLKCIPFLFYTATYTEPKDERFAMSLGADRFLTKPMAPEELMVAIREAIKGYNVHQPTVQEESLATEMEFLRQHNEVLFQKLDKKVHDLEASQQLISNLLDNSPSLIYIVDSEGRFLHLNRQLEISMRHSREEIIGRTREAFLPLDVAASFRANDLRVLATGTPLTFEEVGREPDGEHTYFTVKFPLSDTKGRPYAVCGISTDVSDKKQLERDLQHITDLHVMLYHLNRALRVAVTESELFESTCRVCAERGKFDLVWIGRVPADHSPIRPEFQAGTLVAYATQLQAQPTTQGPIAASLLDDRIVACQDWHQLNDTAPWLSLGEAFGIHSSATLPIHSGSDQTVVLNLYSVQPRFFTADRLVLLEEMAWDLAHALDGLHDSQRRREAEEALAEREMEYRAAFEQGSLGLTQVSLEGRFLRVNRRFCELLGYEAREIIGRHIQEFTYPDDRPNTANLFKSILVGDTDHYHFQKRALRKNGQFLWIELDGCIVHGSDGKALYYLNAMEDISDRKAAEERLQEEKLKLQTLVESIPDLVWLKDTKGVYRFCNPRFESFFGHRQEEILGKTDYDFVNQELADSFRTHDLIAMERGGPSVNEEWVTFASDGHQELLETIKTPMRNIAGETLGVLGIARDVTQNRADQDRLRKLSRALEQNTVAVVITDREGCIEYTNPRFTEITGYGTHEALGQNPRILKSGVTPPEIYRQLWTTILSGQVWQGELQNRRKTGEIYWASLSISPILDDSGSITHFVALQEDITGRMRMGEQLRESEEQYRSLFKNMLNGFALCQMIYGDQGHGEDFIYLAVNHAFESLTGLKDVQGKRVSEVIPGIQESNQDLLDLYGRVARTGVPECFETYLKPLDMWFSIAVYSPKSDQFVAVFDVITERKRAEAAVKAQLSELQRWHEVTLGREDRILDLKREVNALRARMGDPPRYTSADVPKT